MLVLLSIGAVLLFAAAALTDIAHRRIPNAIAAALALLGILRLALAAAGESGSGWLVAGDLAACLAVFAVGALLFHLNLLGGGDVKLMAAGTLWLGFSGLWPFLMLTALAGGALALAYLVLALLRPPGARPSLPYGVAIAVGGVLVTVAP